MVKHGSGPPYAYLTHFFRVSAPLSWSFDDPQESLVGAPSDQVVHALGICYCT
jgi:hypothetical protein